MNERRRVTGPCVGFEARDTVNTLVCGNPMQRVITLGAARSWRGLRGALPPLPLPALAPARRLLQTATPPLDEPPSPAEPSEVNAPPFPGLPTRSRELLLSPPETPSQMQTMGFVGGGTVLGAGGVGILMYTHLEWLKPLLPDLAGVSLLAVGGALLARGAQLYGAAGGGTERASPLAPRPSVGRQAADDDDSHSFQVELLPLNDEVRYASAATAIAGGGRGEGEGRSRGTGRRGGLALSGRPPELNADVQGALADKEKADEAALVAARDEASKELVARVKQELADGTPARRVRQKLAPRLFVIDFDTRARASRDGRPAPPPSTRALLDDLRETVNLLLAICTPYARRLGATPSIPISPPLAPPLFVPIARASTAFTASCGTPSAFGTRSPADAQHTRGRAAHPRPRSTPAAAQQHPAASAHTSRPRGASPHASLGASADVALACVRRFDEVVLRVCSPGGPVTDYGLAAAHFGRLRAAGVRTTACVDLVAASGGYMLACAAHQIYAAPFAIVGSIGVVAQAPNVHKLLDANGVEVVQRTAGQYKRTLQIFQPNTDEGLRKFDEELALIHQAFIGHVEAYRGAQLDANQVCTGESWLATHALPLGLIDGLRTSDAYIRSRQGEVDAYLLRPARPKRPTGLMALLSRTSEAAYATAEAVRAALHPAGWLPRGLQHGLQTPGATAGTGAADAAAGAAWAYLGGAPLGRDGGGVHAGSGLAALGSEPPQLRAHEYGGGALGADATRVDEVPGERTRG